jgi:hypothetical protein
VASTTATSTTKKSKDWNALTREIEEDTKPEGEQALNALFQQIYKDADPDTKRAMMKSFVESNGTCLSTNWNEIGAKQTEVKPPEGMIAKKVKQLFIFCIKFSFFDMFLFVSMIKQCIFICRIFCVWGE